MIVIIFSIFVCINYHLSIHVNIICIVHDFDVLRVA